MNDAPFKLPYKKQTEQEDSQELHKKLYFLELRIVEIETTLMDILDEEQNSLEEVDEDEISEDSFSPKLSRKKAKSGMALLREIKKEK